jgi:thiol-disulfide isomerase/thioredoxin
MSPLRTTVLALIALLALTASGCGAPTSEDASDASGSAVGQKADLGFSATTLDGRSFEGTSLRGQPTVLWFWAPWCSTCRQQIDAVVDVAEQYDGEVEVVAVGGRDDQASIREVAADIPGVTHLVDRDLEVWRHFGVTTQSVYTLIDADGTVVSEGYLTDDELRAEAAEIAGWRPDGSAHAPPVECRE